MELPLPANAMAAEANALHRAGDRRMEGLRLAGELGEEDRVAAGEPHWRGPPGGEGRQIDKIVPMRIGHSHVELQPGAAGVVTAETLTGGQEGVGRLRPARHYPGVVIGLRRHPR